MFISLLRFRILPLTIAAAALLFAVKVADLVRGGSEFARLFSIAQVSAQSEAEPTPPSAPSTPDSSAPAPSAPPPPAAEGKAQAEASGGEPPPATPPSDKPAGEGGGEKTSEPPASPSSPPSPAGDEGSMAAGGRGLNAGARIFSPVELDILQNLDARRIQLETWQKDVEIKENLLTTVEKRIDEKISQIDTMKKELSDMITVYNNEQDSKIKSLVKIYENMKPRDAARIFDEVEMPVLLLVIDRMSEKKAAPILAAMDPKKAKQLTVELAEARRLQSLKLRDQSAAMPPATPPPVAAPPAAPAPAAP